jgi:hypothetical protein
MCGCNNNQIEDEVFEYLNELPQAALKDDDNRLGKALFLVPAPELVILEEKVVEVENLELNETIKRANNCIAYKWAPYSMVSKLKLKDIKPQGCRWCGNRRGWCSRVCPCGNGNYC